MGGKISGQTENVKSITVEIDAEALEGLVLDAAASNADVSPEAMRQYGTVHFSGQNLGSWNGAKVTASIPLCEEEDNDCADEVDEETGDFNTIAQLGSFSIKSDEFAKEVLRNREMIARHLTGGGVEIKAAYYEVLATPTRHLDLFAEDLSHPKVHPLLPSTEVVRKGAETVLVVDGPATGFAIGDSAVIIGKGSYTICGIESFRHGNGKPGGRCGLVVKDYPKWSRG